MNEEPSPAAESAEEPSVFGNLPRSRPGARSPRRDESAEKAAARASRGTDAGVEDTASQVGEERGYEQRPPPPPEPDTEEPDSDRSGIEDLAWAGVAAAAEAATLGVRLANRALGSLRGESEKP